MIDCLLKELAVLQDVTGCMPKELAVLQGVTGCLLKECMCSPVNMRLMPAKTACSR